MSKDTVNDIGLRERKTRLGLGTRYDKFTPNGIAKEIAHAPGMGHFGKTLGKKFCVKCEQTKPIKGGKMRAGMFLCEECKP